MAGKKKLRAVDLAELAGMKPGSFYRQTLRGATPPPDGHDGGPSHPERGGRFPYWYTSTAKAWLRTRPSRGRPKKVFDTT